MPSINGIVSAKKRCLSMGSAKHSARRDFEYHPLAACISNHSHCIDVELAEPIPDYLSILFWLRHMACAINNYCDQHHVTGDDAAEYWLWKYAQRVDCVCNFSVLR